MPLIDVEFAPPRVVSQQRTDGTALPRSAHTSRGPASLAWGEAARRAGDAALLLADPSSDRAITAPTV